MRNPLRSSLAAGGLILSAALFGTAIPAAPAGATSFSHPMARAAYGSAAAPRPRPAARHATRPARFRVARSAVRAVADVGGDVWAKLRSCESGGRYTANTGNGFYGAYQFHPRTWRALGYPGLPSQAPPEVQDEAARKLQARSGWGQWPVCSRRVGARR